MIARLCRALISLLFPRRGWRALVLDYRRGRIVWPVPGRPDAPHVLPFPIQWTASRVLALGEGPRRGWEPVVDAPCAACQRPLGQNGVRCVRCAVLLHESCAGMETTTAIPSCSVCRLSVGAA